VTKGRKGKEGRKEGKGRGRKGRERKGKEGRKEGRKEGKERERRERGHTSLLVKAALSPSCFTL
jgi:hypothetical protein